jgi:hypothetical protein
MKVVTLNTPLMLQSEFKLLVKDLNSFTKQLAIQTDLIQKMNKWVDSVKALEKARDKETQRKLKQAQVNSLGDDLAKMSKRVRRHPTNRGAY